MESDKIVEAILKEYRNDKSFKEKGMNEKINFLVKCIESDMSSGGDIMRALYLDGKSFRATARSMYLSRGAVEYNKKKAVRQYAERFEQYFKTLNCLQN
ncbi:MAG: hypothetical protein LBT30_07105 [Clostridiales bacterium]|jgi:hypothetical protein|nr:hypothetical protein [Clostridiales bacterium]